MKVFSARDMLAELVRFDTTSRLSNLPLIDFVENYLDQFGVPYIRVDYEDGRKTNLYATIGPDVAGGIVLSGHTDVVPVDGQDWQSDPFTLTERGGKLYGRGTADMKGFIAVALALVPRFIKMKLKTPIHLALSCDEEVGCRGVRPLLAHLRDHLKQPRAAFIGEPTLMKVVNGHKSAVTFNTEIKGHEAHSSLTDQGVNAIMVAGEVLTEINSLRQELIAIGDPSGRYDPPYSTIHVGLIKGGTAKNIIPRHCEFQWETRLLPNADRNLVPARLEALRLKLEPGMKAVAQDVGISTKSINEVPGLMPEPDSEAEHLALHAAGANATHAVSYCTEAGLFQSIGIPSVICGPGNIEQAHKPDEYVEESQLALCETYLLKLAESCL
ncbi:acetylornithine deacetylase [Aestuariivirga litoralis]|uniref:acetylornithine deacetylase n=1 Tax=Aestuariivirga litoralis TaxID=2650924 RepID=UPI0018C4F54D|nr:acetylornithine deacetylase [Aestuariivirga litoralis]MBG1233570.1 acetylornithine deacetylase [Aestuariivirga litoralis]